ncbi:MAG: Uma2 family endonuclease [Rhodopirellula sp.]|nr:Uma2 family endonuclease [Rhodopirellula sp.]
MFAAEAGRPTHVWSRTANRVVLSRVNWTADEALLAETDRPGTRFTYDRGLLEITTPSCQHQRIKSLIGSMIEIMTVELNIPISRGGATTLKNELSQRGVEPDECYYVANEAKVRGRDNYDPSSEPPDLAIEVDITSSSVDQIGIYAVFGVPEVWLYDTIRIRVYVLQPDGIYSQQPRSNSFPFLPLDEVERFLQRRDTTDETTLIREFRDWVRNLGR